MKNLLSSTLLSALLAVAANASIITYTTSMNGANESPATGSAGTGTASVTYDNVLHTLLVNINFTGLSGTTSAAHVHCCTTNALSGTAGVATTTPTFAGFPLGVTSGTYNALLDLTQSSSWNPAFITANGGTTASAEAVFAAGLAAGKTYLNIHTSVNPSGEIRGFLLTAPEPSTALLLMPVAALIAIRLRRKPV